jgi:hypothetical protein
VVGSGLEVLRDFADAMFVAEQVRAVGDDQVGTTAYSAQRGGAPVEIRVG